MNASNPGTRRASTDTGWFTFIRVIAAMVLALACTAAVSSATAQAEPASAYPPIGLQATPDGKGYWIAASDGGVFAFGSAGFFGSMGGKALNSPVVGMAAAPDGKGYWLVASDGGVFAFGSAGFFGSMGGKPLNSPVVGMAAAPDGKGYWLVASDGGVFAFGSAGFFGSMGGKPLNSPVVGIAPTKTGAGYREVGADGGLFAFGDATYFGSMADQLLNAPVNGITTYAGGGYWMLAKDGGVFAFGNAQYYGRVVYTTPTSHPTPTPATTTKAYVLPHNAVPYSALGAPHHDYPAADLPAATGTPFYAVTAGNLIPFSDSKCGTGFQLNGDDGGIYVYCHASARSISGSQRVTAGRQLGLTGATGDATGPHLHFQVSYQGSRRCPQQMLKDLYNGVTPTGLGSLPTSGCTN